MTRIAIRPDVYPVTVDDGVYILTHGRPVRLRGASIAAWIDRLVPHLDGSRSVAELTAALPPAHRELVERIVTTLRECGVVRPVALGEDRADQRFVAEIGYIDYFRDHAAAEFDRFRSLDVLLVGEGPLAGHLASAVTRTGVREVRTAAAGAELRVHPADLVLHVVDARHETEAMRLHRACRAAGVPLVQVVHDRDQVWLLPARRDGAGTIAGGWAGVRWRLAALDPTPSSSGPPAVEPGGTTARVVASQVAQQVFRVFTGVAASPTRPRVTRIDLGTWRSTRHNVVAHPFCLEAGPVTEARFRQRVGELGAATPLAEAEFSSLAAGYLDQRLGIFAFDDHGWARVPLHVDEAVVPDPLGPAGGSAPPARRLGVGFTYRSARCRAALQALAWYGAMMVDPRRLVDPEGRPLSAPGADPSAALAQLHAGELAAAWGYQLDDPTRVGLVPATEVFPRLRGGTLADSATPPGVRAGYSWGEAVTRGVLDHCLALASSTHHRPPRPFPQLDLDHLRLDADGGRARDLLRHLDRVPQVYDLTGTAHVPVLAFCLGEATVAYAAGTTRAEAVTDGLIQVVRWIQARAHREPAYQPPQLPPLPPEMRGQKVRGHDGPGFDLAAAVAWLRERGKNAMAVPLDHDPGVNATFPFTVHVVLRDA